MFLEWDLLVLGRYDVGVVSWQSSVCHCCQVSYLGYVVTSGIADMVLFHNIYSPFSRGEGVDIERGVQGVQAISNKSNRMTM